MKKAFIALTIFALMAAAVTANECKDDDECGTDTGYTCRGGNPVRYVQHYRCNIDKNEDGTCIKSEKTYRDEPEEICDPQDRMECIEGKSKCQSFALDIPEMTTITIPEPTTTTLPPTTSSTATSTTSTTTSVKKATTSTAEPPSTTTTTIGKQKEPGILQKVTHERPIELNLEYLKKLLNLIMLWD